MQMKQDPKAHTLYLLIGDVSWYWFYYL